MPKPTEIRLETQQGTMAGLAWSGDGGPRVLALHGWLDNAASFLPLAALLGRVELVALDFPGHGHSAHRHPTAHYHFMDYAFDVDAALSALGWADGHLLGHSMGASVATIYAAGAPERVRSLVLLDGLGPLTTPPQGTAERLRRSLRKSRQPGGETRRFNSLDEMVQARRNASELSEASARLVCERSARPLGRQFVWRSDPALNWVSSVGLTEDQVLDLLAHVECPVLTYQALPESRWFSREDIEARKSAITRGRHLVIEGNHHFHMDAPDAIAETIHSFILQNDHPPRQGPGHE